MPWPATVGTFLLATGATLGWSWSSFSHAVRVLEVEFGGHDNKAKEEWIRGRTHYPTGAETVYGIVTTLMALTGLMLLAGFGRSVLAGATAWPRSAQRRASARPMQTR